MQDAFQSKDRTQTKNFSRKTTFDCSAWMNELPVPTSDALRMKDFEDLWSKKFRNNENETNSQNFQAIYIREFNFEKIKGKSAPKT